MLKRKKLFGGSIAPNCEYCAHSSDREENTFFCKKWKHAQRPQKCKYFYYDPLKRIPLVAPPLPKMDAEDFAI